MVVQAGFEWSGSPTELFSEVDRRLQTLGWSNQPVRQGSGSEFVWSKRLTDGSGAQAMLDSSPAGPPAWEFVATAPPVGRPVTGC